jgi:hypothetical protein
MRYMMLIYEDETGSDQVSEAELAETMAAYNAFGEESRQAGVNLGGEALHPTPTATTVKVKDGQVLTTDGPFAETKEALGGYYLMECANLDEAIKWAAKIPGARSGSIEIRPIMEF